MRIVLAGDITSKYGFVGDYVGSLDGSVKVENAQWRAVESIAIPGDVILAEADAENNAAAVDAVLEIKRRMPHISVIFIMPGNSESGLAARLLRSGADECAGGVEAFRSAMEKYEVGADGTPGDFGIIGANEQMKFIVNFMKKVAPSGIPVLIEGESGTGKELVAYGIHKASTRAEEPFIPVNCGAIPKELLENEFFGHEKGGFTGAHGEKKGLFEVADRGTLFIDEIGEMDPSAQVKLLRALETGRFMRIGGDREIKVNVRIVAATNRDVKEEMRAGRFRKDLFYRLSAIMIKLPPLKERSGDVPALCEYFLKHSRVLPEEARSKKINRPAMDALKAYEWPGNVRELLNVVERAVVLSEKRAEIVPADLPQHILEKEPQTHSGYGSVLPDGAANMSLDDYVGAVEKEFIGSVLKKCGDDRIKTAEALRISVANLYRKIKKYNLS
jgi:transcriptional regulator with PAS, ATPase and Fis domain